MFVNTSGEYLLFICGHLIFYNDPDSRPLIQIQICAVRQVVKQYVFKKEKRERMDLDSCICPL